MANEKRLIDANALAENWFYTNDTGTQVVELLEIEQAPTVDAVEVVHCCDCKNCTAFQYSADLEAMLTCCYHSFRLVDPTDYCVWGERKDNA